MDDAPTKPAQRFRIETASSTSRIAASIAILIVIVLALLPVFAGRTLI
jgi:branched-chain amino acid transport system permease protein